MEPVKELYEFILRDLETGGFLNVFVLAVDLETASSFLEKDYNFKTAYKILKVEVITSKENVRLIY